MKSFRDRYGYDDPLADMEPEPESVAPQRAVRPKLSKAEQDAARVQKKRQDSRTQAASTVRRRKWEGSPEGQARMRDIQDLVTEHHNELAAKHPDRLNPISRTSMSKAQIYHVLGVTNTGHGYGDQQLPGMENPHAAPQPPRWEDLSDEQKTETQRRLRVHGGTNLDRMGQDFGSQLDQAVYRAHRAGHSRSSTGEPVPFTKHFYDEHPSDAPEPLDRPKEMMRESRQFLKTEIGRHVDPSVHTAVVSHVSPNLKFTRGKRGQRTSPNIEAAESVFQQVHEGKSHWNMTSGVNRAGVANQSRPANTQRAAIMLDQVGKGAKVGEARNLPSDSNEHGSLQWGSKTGPFVNSFDASHPDFLVADVHTGGGGMFPHLATEKPFKANGSKQREKSDREKAMERSGMAIPGSETKKVTFHSAADFAARQALAERGLGTSVRQSQASQWGEEQLQRKAKSPKLDASTHEDAYPHPSSHLVNPNQMRLF